MATPTLTDLTAFTAVAEHRSFRRAADALGQSPSAISHAMRSLEARLGVRLIHRTTRSVALTEAGVQLLAGLAPALRDLDAALAAVATFGGAPSGTVRINAPEVPSRLLLREVVPVLHERHPGVAVDLVTEGRLIDIVADGFDAGVRLGEAVPQDMVAVRFGGPVRFLAVASPSYLARAGAPTAPDDLRGHDCIRHRMPGGRLYRWEFERHGKAVAIDVPGSLTLDRLDLMAEAAIDGRGIALIPDRAAAPGLADQRLVAILEDWCPAIPSLFLYYPGHRQVPPALRAFIDVLREVLP